MEKEFLIQCEKYLGKLSLLLEQKKKEDLEFRDFFQLILNTEKQTIQSINKKEIQKSDNIFVKNIQKEIKALKENKEQNLIMLQIHFIKPIDQVISDTYFNTDNMLKTLIELIKHSLGQCHQLEQKKQDYYKICEQFEQFGNQTKEALKDLHAGLITEDSYHSIQATQKKFQTQLDQKKQEYELQIDFMNNSFIKVSAMLKPFLEQISKFVGNKNALFQIKIEQFHKVKNYFYKEGNPTDKIMNNYTKEKIKIYQNDNQDKLLIEMYDKFKINLNLTTQEEHKVEFISYEKQKQIKDNDLMTGGFIFIENDQSLNVIEEQEIQKILGYLIDSYGSDKTEYPKEAKLKILLSKISVIQEFLIQFKKKLGQFEGNLILQNQKGLYLKKIIEIILQELVKTEFIDSRSILELLEIFCKLKYWDKNTRRDYFQEFENALLWKKIDVWIALYSLILENQTKANKKQKFNLINVFDNLKKKVLGLEIQEKEEIQKLIELNTQKKEILQKIIFFLKRLRKGISLELGKEIIQETAKYHNLPTNLTVELFDEFEDDYVFATIKNLTCRKENKQKVFQVWKKNIIFKYSFSYLNFPEKRKIILLNREINQRLQMQLFKDFSYSRKIDWSKRLQIWSVILKINSKETPSLQISDFTKDKLDPSISTIIMMDVKRSFTNDKNFPKQDLTEILQKQTYLMEKTYGYCQGMNYLAGFFLKYIPNKELAFKLYYQTLVLKMNIFDDKFEKLQSYFYVIDKLIKVYLPNLSSHFEKTKVKVSFVASSWLITIFTNYLQYSKDSFLVKYIMDIFQVENYLGLFKAIIVILGYLEKDLLKLEFEYALEFMSKLPKHEIFVNSEFPEYIKLKRQGISFKELSQKCKFFSECEFVYNFKRSCYKLNINKTFVIFFESRYKEIMSNMNQLIININD